MSCGTVAHRGRHAAPLGNVGFHWFYKVFLTKRRAPDREVQQQGHFRRGATSCVLLVFPMVLMDSGKPCSDPVVYYFLAKQKCFVLQRFGEVLGYLLLF